jgi:hypothetical protein
VANQSKPPLTELVVMSRPAVVGQATPGHIMLAVSRAGVGEQAWGFYPGGIKDEIQVGGWQRYTTSSVIRITETQYSQLLAAIADYKKGNTYHLFSSNCRHFVVTVLRQASIPVDEDTLWPNDQGKMVVKQYGEGWGRCLSADAE